MKQYVLVLALVMGLALYGAHAMAEHIAQSMDDSANRIAEASHG